MKTKTKKHNINTSKTWIPDGYTLEENRSLGKIEWNPENITLWLSEKQKTSYVKGEDLLKEIKNPLTSSVLRYLLDNQELIPEKWKEKTNGYITWIYFHGTVLRDSYGGRCVLCLCWVGGWWDWRVLWLDNDWRAFDPSAVLASSPQNSESLNLPSDALSLDLHSRLQNVEQFLRNNFKGFTV